MTEQVLSEGQIQAAAEEWIGELTTIAEGGLGNERGSPSPGPSPFRSRKNLDWHQKGRWVTMPADGPEGAGSHVYIEDDGTISKGPKETVGKKPDELGESESKPKRTKPKAPSIEKRTIKPAKPKEEIKRPDVVPGEPISIKFDSSQIPKEIVDMGTDVISQLNSEVQQQVARYMKSGYAHLNEEMRKCPPKFECLDVLDKRKKEDIESALEKAPDFSEPITVYRGIVPEDPELRGRLLERMEKLVGSKEAFSMPSITSTSMDVNVAISFGEGKSPILFRIRAKRGLYVESLTERSNRGEHEVIQASKTKYRVIGVKRQVDILGKSGKAVTSVPVIYLEEV